MAEGLATEDGTAIDIEAARAAAEREFDQTWDAAMNEPEPDEPVHPAPPVRQELTEEELGAKFGWTTDKDGNRRAKRAKGRPKNEARVTDKPPPVQAAKQPPKGAPAAGEPRDYTEDLFGVAALAHGSLCAAGQLADAGAVKHHAPRIVPALNRAAQENPTIRRGVEWMLKGGAVGALVAAVLPFALQIGVNHGRVPIEKVAALGVRHPLVLHDETLADIAELTGQQEQEAA